MQIRSSLHTRVVRHRRLAVPLLMPLLLSIVQDAGADEPPNAGAMSGITVYGQRPRDPAVTTPQAEALMEVAGALRDPISASFSLPGVVYAGGDAGAPAVRGSAPGDNLYLADGLPIAYVFHPLDVGAAVFSDHVIGDFNLYPAAFGPEFVNVTGAVFDIALRDPRPVGTSASVDASMLRSGVFVESALTKDIAAYASYRESMLHLFIKPGTENEGVVLQEPPRNRDYQVKAVWRAGEGRKLSLLFTGAQDAAAADLLSSSQTAARNPDFGGDARTTSRYDSQSLTWEGGDAGNTRLLLSAGHSRESNDTTYGRGYFYGEQIDRDVLRGSIDHPVSDAHSLRISGEWSRSRRSAGFNQVLFVCNEFDPTCVNERRGLVRADPSLFDTSRSLGLSDSWRVTPGLRLEFGVQMLSNSFTQERFFEPRGAVQWQPAAGATLTLKAGRYDRFPDLASLLPGLGNPKLRSPTADHLALEWRQEFKGGWSLRLEPYYKRLNHLPLALDAAAPDAALLYASDVSGRSIGADLLLQKSGTGRWSGWLSLSASRSERTDERSGITRRYTLDTPLILNAVWNYQWRPTIRIGARLTLRSGQPDTPIIGVEPGDSMAGGLQPVYGEPFSTRLPLYRRLDVKVSRQLQVGRFPAELSLDIINLTNAHNVEARDLDYVLSKPGAPAVIKSYEGFGVFPAFSFRISF
jgi:hypothetical protein